LWYGERNAISNAIDYAKFFSRSHDTVIRACNEAGDVIETQEQNGSRELAREVPLIAPPPDDKFLAEVASAVGR
jgi:hypothetical protein